MVLAPAGLKLASAGGQDVFHPLALAAIGERDREAVRRAKDIYRSSIDLARFAANVSDDSKAGKPAGEARSDTVGDREIEARQRFLAEAHHQHP